MTLVRAQNGILRANSALKSSKWYFKS